MDRKKGKRVAKGRQGHRPGLRSGTQDSELGRQATSSAVETTQVVRSQSQVTSFVGHPGERVKSCRKSQTDNSTKNPFVKLEALNPNVVETLRASSTFRTLVEFGEVKLEQKMEAIERPNDHDYLNTMTETVKVEPKMEVKLEPKTEPDVEVASGATWPVNSERNVVEEILGERMRRGTPYFLCKWKGFPHSRNSWESIGQLDDCTELIQAFRDGRQSEVVERQGDVSGEDVTDARKDIPGPSITAGGGSDAVANEKERPEAQEPAAVSEQLESALVTTSQLDRDEDLMKGHGTEENVDAVEEIDQSGRAEEPALAEPALFFVEQSIDSALSQPPSTLDDGVFRRPATPISLTRAPLRARPAKPLRTAGAQFEDHGSASSGKGQELDRVASSQGNENRVTLADVQVDKELVTIPAARSQRLGNQGSLTDGGGEGAADTKEIGGPLPASGFARGLEAERIVGMTPVKNEPQFLVKWRGSDFADLVPVKEANDKCPQVVIAFYEGLLKWNRKRSLEEMLRPQEEVDAEGNEEVAAENNKEE